MKFTMYSIAAIAICALVANPAAGSLVTNGDFESWTDGNPDGWDLYDGGGADQVPGFDGGSAAALTKTQATSLIRQEFSENLTDQFQVSYDFAVDMSGISADAPATQVTLRDDDGNPYINLRVSEDGSLSLREGAQGGEFNQLPDSADLVSTSDFTDDTINAYKIVIEGNFGAEYDVSLIDLSDDTELGAWTDLTYYQKDPSTEGNGYLAAVYFDPGRGEADSGNWHVDNVAVAVPEPATMGLLAAGGVALLLRRRRKA